jgi:hypothetical protein
MVLQRLEHLAQHTCLREAAQHSMPAAVSLVGRGGEQQQATRCRLKQQMQLVLMDQVLASLVPEAMEAARQARALLLLAGALRTA